MGPSQVSDEIVQKIKHSNLHYMLHENAFSINVTIRKKFMEEKARDNENKLEDKYSDVANENKTLKLKTFMLEKKIIELKEALDKQNIDNKELSDVLDESQKELNKKQKSLKQLNNKNEYLQKLLESSESETEVLTYNLKEYATLIKTKEEKIHELKAKINESPIILPAISKSTNTPSVQCSTTATQYECSNATTNMSMSMAKPITISLNKDCTHSGCFLRQPKTPAHFPHSKPLYLAPPPNIRLLPRNVYTYQDFRNLHISHECEECTDDSLFYNYHEIVSYPDPGPCGGTSGSQVKTCPNHPNSKITITAIQDQKRNENKRTLKCISCSKKFSNQGNLIFHMNRIHGWN